MARYIVRAKGAGGPIEFNKPLTIDQALKMATELRKAEFEHITIVNTQTGVAISSLEELIGST